MPSSKQPRYSEPVWWTVEHTVIWERHLPSLRTDFQRRTGEQNRARIAKLGPDDPVVQKDPPTPRNVAVERAYAVADNNWEVGTAWEQIEPGVRYGVGARTQYPHYERWNDELEARLRKEWEETNAPSTWERVKRAVRHGFEYMGENANPS
jgi:hypothetical protein